MSTLVSEKKNRVLGGYDEERLLMTFFVLFKTARIMEPNNPTFINQIQNLHERLKAISTNTNQIAIKQIAGRYFVNEKMVRFDDKGLSGATSIIQDWEKLGLAGVVWDRDITIDEIEYFYVFMVDIKALSFFLAHY